MSNNDSNDNFVFDGFDLNDPGLDGWDGQGGGPPEIPLGEHLFEAVSAKIVNTKAGDGKNVEIEWKVVGGEADGKTTRAWYHCASEKGLKTGSKKRLAHVFRDVLRVTNAAGGFETKDIPGKRMYAVVSHEEQVKYDPQTQQNKTYLNVSLSCERAWEGAEDQAQQAAPAAPPKAPTAPPSRPPAAPPTAARPPARPPAAPARRT